MKDDSLYVLLIEMEGEIDSPLIFKSRGSAMDFVIKDLKLAENKKFTEEELCNIRDNLGSEGWYRDDDLGVTYSIYEGDVQE